MRREVGEIGFALERLLSSQKGKEQARGDSRLAPSLRTGMRVCASHASVVRASALAYNTFISYFPTRGHPPKDVNLSFKPP